MPPQYCTRDDVLTRAPAIKDDVEAMSRIKAGIVAARAEIHGALAVRYETPFDPVPELIKEIATDLAASWAICSGFSGSDNSEQGQFGERLYKLGKGMLDQVVAGTMALDDVSENKVIENRRPLIKVTGNPCNQLKRFDPTGVCGPKIPRNNWPNS